MQAYPPRRGSPAAPRAPLGRRSTADAPPKKRFDATQATGSKPSSASAPATSSGQPPSMWTVDPSTWSRGRAIASSTGTSPPFMVFRPPPLVFPNGRIYADLETDDPSPDTIGLGSI